MPPVTGDQVVGVGSHRALQYAVTCVASSNHFRGAWWVNDGGGIFKALERLFRAIFLATELRVNTPANSSRIKADRHISSLPRRAQVKHYSLVAWKVQGAYDHVGVQYHPHAWVWPTSAR